MSNSSGSAHTITSRVDRADLVNDLVLGTAGVTSENRAVKVSELGLAAKLSSALNDDTFCDPAAARAFGNPDLLTIGELATAILSPEPAE
jgi:hypothetical protein